MRQTGTTLPEMMAVLAAVAIMLSIALPGMGALMDSRVLSAATNDILASLHLARSESIKRGSRAVLCPSEDGNVCSGGGWHGGWLVFQDLNNNAARDDGEALILVRPALPAGIRLTGNQFVSNYNSYAPNGGTKLVGGFWRAGTLTVCKATDSPAKARQLVISTTGRVRTVKLDLDNCP